MIDQLRAEMNYTTTDNGATTNLSTLSKCVDYFAIGGSMRNMDMHDAINVFKAAYYENPLYAVRLSFMFRDIRFGQGQRKPFRDQLNWIAFNYPDVCNVLLKYIQEYGRWDDLYSVFDTPCENTALSIIKLQLDLDLDSMKAFQPISLLGKWLKRINTSSHASVIIGHKIRKYLKLSCKDYRKLCVLFNEYLKVPENIMSSNNWNSLTYEHIPSKCMLRNKNAFMKHDQTRFQQYLLDVQSGKTKINASTIYPYEIVEKILNNSITDLEADVLWNNLTSIPFDDNAIVVADVSGSMTGMPMNVCISLAIYMSQNAEGIYKNKFITFTDHPELVEIIDGSITDKVKQLENAKWGMNTNLRRVFECVLNAAVSNNLPADEMVKTLYIISDMQFDQGISDRPNETLFNELKKMFNEAGYQLPKLVFWNVNGSSSNFPVIKNELNTLLISGFSPNILRYINEGILTPEQMMLDVINNDRYSVIEI